MANNDLLSGLFGGIAAGANLWAQQRLQEEQDKREEARAVRLEALAEQRWNARQKIQAQMTPPQEVVKVVPGATGGYEQVTTTGRVNPDTLSWEQQETARVPYQPKIAQHFNRVSGGNEESVAVDEFGHEKVEGSSPRWQPQRPEGPTADARDFADYQRMTPDQRALYDQMKGRAVTASAGDPTLTGQPFLDTLPPGQAPLIKAIAEGRQAMPNARSSQGIAIARAVQQYDPGADSSTIAGRIATQKDFSPAGKSGQALKAFDQLGNHMAELKDAMDKLGNTSFPQVNRAANYVGSDVLGHPAVKSFNIAAEAVANELAKAWRGGQTAEADIKAWKEELSPNMSPDQQKEALRRLSHLLKGADEALRARYRDGMKLNDDPKSFVPERTRQLLNKIAGEDVFGDEPGTEQQPGRAELDAPGKTGPVQFPRPAPSAPVHFVFNPQTRQLEPAQ